ncbi:hypothetical protein ACE1SV_42780 [Streptomyces sennicomposti]
MSLHTEELLGMVDGRLVAIQVHIPVDQFEASWHDNFSPYNVGSVERLSFGEIARRSTLIHELRHFHDQLLMPMASRAMMHRLRASIAAHWLGMLLEDGGYNFFPRPLSWWVSMTNEEQDRYISRINAHLRRKGIPEVRVAPFLRGWVRDQESEVEDPLRLVVGMALLDQMSAEYVTHGAHLPTGGKWETIYGVSDLGMVSPATLMESSALLVQFEQVRRRFGDHNAATFWRELKAGPVITLAKKWVSCTPRDPVEPNIDSSLPINYALMQEVSETGRTTPVEVYGALDIALRTGHMRTSGTLAQVLDDWDSSIRRIDPDGFLPGTQRSAESVRDDEAFKQEIEALSLLYFNWLDMQSVSSFWDQWSSARDYMAYRFWFDPIAYTNPSKYLSNLDDFVEPPLWNTAAPLPTTPSVKAEYPPGSGSATPVPRRVEVEGDIGYVAPKIPGRRFFDGSAVTVWKVLTVGDILLASTPSPASTYGVKVVQQVFPSLLTPSIVKQPTRYWYELLGGHHEWPLEVRLWSGREDWRETAEAARREWEEAREAGETEH